MLETKRTAEYEGDGDINRCWSTWNGLKKLGKKNGRIGNPRKIETIRITALLRSAKRL